jgi:diguanylate cyclase (GGDEF)-like protein/PAS domain S-box-containing protein
MKAWRIHLILGTIAVVIYYLLPAAPGSIWYEVISGSAVVATIVGVRKFRPTRPSAWYLFAAGLFSNLCGDLTFAYYESIVGVAAPFPSIADLFYLGQYPFYAAALFTMMRSRQPRTDLGSFLDATIITTGVGVLVWIYLLVPYADDPALSLAERAISVAYPLSDILLLLAAVQLAVTPGIRAFAARAFPAVFLTLVATDSLYAMLLLKGTYAVPHPIDAGWLMSYVAIGALALHPSMTVLTDPSHEERAETLSPRRLLLLASASLLSPAVMFAQAIRSEELHVPVVAGGSAVLFLLVLMRMSGLVTAVTSSLDGYRRAVSRERILRRAGIALGLAQTHEDIYAAALSTASELCGEVPHMKASVYRGGRGEFVRAAGAEDGATSALTTLFDWSRALDPAGTGRPRIVCMRVEEGQLLADDGRGAAGADAAIVIPIAVLDEVTGFLMVGGDSVISEELQGALETLASQLALALEGAALAQDLLERQSEARFRSLVHNLSDVITIIDRSGMIRYTSPSVEQIFGFADHEIIGELVSNWIHQDDLDSALTLLSEASSHPGATATTEWRLRHIDGKHVPSEIQAHNLLDDPNVRGIVLTIRDVSERKSLEEELRRLAFHDALTGLPNRALFKDRVEHALQERTAVSDPPAVLFFDLDDFKTINDSMGHTVGDELLIAVAGRLSQAVRPADTVARLGGDEFAVLLRNVADHTVPGTVADRILDSLTRPVTLQGREVFVRGSVGIALADSPDAGVDDLLRDADVAMYIAKAREHHGHQTFEPLMRTAATERLELKADLQRAIEQGQFHLAYQPIIELKGRRITGVEALLRWQHPERGNIPPLEFLSVAEETGMIVPLGGWILKTACAQAVKWEKEHPYNGHLAMSVNLSSRQVQEAHMVDEVKSILLETNMDPGNLILEITESVLMQDTDVAIEKLKALKGLGVKVAIDDFGTGYSSLSYLERFPIDILKIDKSFVDGMADGSAESALAAAIVKLCRALGLSAVAEGIEGADQMERLVELRCQFGQGYYFAKPLDSEHMSMLLATGLVNPASVRT